MSVSLSTGRLCNCSGQSSGTVFMTLIVVVVGQLRAMATLRADHLCRRMYVCVCVHACVRVRFRSRMPRAVYICYVVFHGISPLVEGFGMFT